MDRRGGKGKSSAPRLHYCRNAALSEDNLLQWLRLLLHTLDRLPSMIMLSVLLPSFPPTPSLPSWPSVAMGVGRCCHRRHRQKKQIENRSDSGQATANSSEKSNAKKTAVQEGDRAAAAAAVSRRHTVGDHSFQFAYNSVSLLTAQSSNGNCKTCGCRGEGEMMKSMQSMNSLCVSSHSYIQLNVSQRAAVREPLLLLLLFND